MYIYIYILCSQENNSRVRQWGTQNCLFGGTIHDSPQFPR